MGRSDVAAVDGRNDVAAVDGRNCCRVSPLLFGLFLDGVEGHVQQHAPQTGVHVGGVLLQMLLYADDIVLLARSEADLQAQLNALHGFCAEKGMSVNVAKTKVMVFNGIAGRQSA
jgi:hypothetical protein